MKKNIDIILGILAWCCAIPGVLLWFPIDFGLFYLDFIFLYIPLVWIFLVIGVIVFKQRKLWDLGWVWFSFPLVFYPWILPAIVLMIGFMRSNG